MALLLRQGWTFTHRRSGCWGCLKKIVRRMSFPAQWQLVPDHWILRERPSMLLVRSVDLTAV